MTSTARKAKGQKILRKKIDENRTQRQIFQNEINERNERNERNEKNFVEYGEKSEDESESQQIRKAATLSALFGYNPSQKELDDMKRAKLAGEIGLEDAAFLALWQFAEIFLNAGTAAGLIPEGLLPGFLEDKSNYGRRTALVRGLAAGLDMPNSDSHWRPVQASNVLAELRRRLLGPFVDILGLQLVDGFAPVRSADDMRAEVERLGLEEASKDEKSQKKGEEEMITPAWQRMLDDLYPLIDYPSSSSSSSSSSNDANDSDDKTPLEVAARFFTALLLAEAAGGTRLVPQGFSFINDNKLPIIRDLDSARLGAAMAESAKSIQKGAAPGVYQEDTVGLLARLTDLALWGSMAQDPSRWEQLLDVLAAGSSAIFAADLYLTGGSSLASLGLGPLPAAALALTGLFRLAGGEERARPPIGRGR